MSETIVWFDLETTGIKIATDRIIEICMIKTDLEGNEIASYYSLVNPGPGVESSQAAIDKHGITKEMLEDCDSFDFIAQSVVDFIGDSHLGGYNVIFFDIPMLVEELMRSGIVFNYRNRSIIDPYLIYTKYEGRTLEAAYKKYTGKILENAHRAENDIRATMEIFDAQKKLYEMPDSLAEIDAEVNEPMKNRVDLNGKFKFAEIDGKKEIIFSFGKYEGRPFREVFEKDQRYLEWLIDKGEFPTETKIIAKKIMNRMKAEINMPF